MNIYVTNSFTVSYWDWTLVANNPWKTEYPSMWFDGPSGMGGNSPGDGECVKTGPFRDPKWSLPATNKCLTRRFKGTLPNAVAVESKLLPLISRHAILINNQKVKNFLSPSKKGTKRHEFCFIFCLNSFYLLIFPRFLVMVAIF